MIYNIFFSGQESLLVLISAFIIGGIFKTQEIFLPVFTMLTEKIKSKRLALMTVSLVSGILPVEGRVSVSAPILDSLVHKDSDECCGGKHARGKIGILDFIATHHYYLWSPLEKSVIIIMAGLSLTYAQVLSYTIFPIIVYICFLTFIIFKYIDEKDIILSENKKGIWEWKHIFNIIPFISGIALSIFYPPFYVFPLVALYYVITNRKVSFSQLVSFIKWKILIFVAAVIAMANIVKYNSDTIIGFSQTFFNSTEPSFFTISALIISGAGVSFILGSSSKYAGICVALTLILGIKYFPIIFMAEYCAYLLSPMHKCLIISAGYFNTKLTEFYKYIGILAALMLSSGIAVYYF